MTLLLGPPSSGKTTFLLALAGKLNSTLKVGGKITYNGHEMNEFVPQRTSTYISQYDQHIGNMTVRESLAFSASCQGVGYGYEVLAELARREKAANIKPDPDIDVFMKILGLDICADTYVGDQTLRGISGGQRKRVTTVYESLVYSSWLRLAPEVDSSTRKMFIEEVMELVELFPLREAIVILPGTSGLSNEQRKRLTIAVELVANPPIIFMDEPTSGLDARAAAIVMRTVRNTVDTSRTVVCIVHQPSIDIFGAFDELLLLKRGGEETYVGLQGRNSCHLINYLEGINGVRKINEGYNPATWMLEVTSGAQEVILNIDFADVYKKSELYD